MELLLPRLAQVAENCKNWQEKARYHSWLQAFRQVSPQMIDRANIINTTGKINKELQMFRYRDCDFQLPTSDEILLAVAEVLVGNADVQSLYIAEIKCAANSPGYASFLRCIPTLKSLRKLNFEVAPLCQPLFAAIFVSRVKELEIGIRAEPVEIPKPDYNSLCLFLQSYPNLVKLTLYIQQKGDPSLSKLFGSLKKNPSTKLKVSFFAIDRSLNMLSNCG